MFKKILLFAFVIVFSSGLILAKNNANRPVSGKPALKLGVDKELTRVLNFNTNPIVNKATMVAGDVIGYTYYDYMTNGAMDDRIFRFADGTTMIGTMACWSGDASTSQRGSYYQYNNGTKWLDTTGTWRRIESARRGWTSLGVLEKDKVAFVLSHVAAELNVNLGTPDAPSWTSIIVPGTAGWSWPKLAVDDGADGSLTNVYASGGATAALPNPFIRSTDAGASWSDVVILADTNSTEWQQGYIGTSADETPITAKDGKVAVLNAKTDGNVTLYVSEDNGVTFTTKTLQDILAVDNSLDSVPFDSSFFPAEKSKMLGLPHPDGTGDVHIDKNGVVHCAWGTREIGYYIDTDSLGNAVRDDQGKLQRTFFISDWAGTGIYYWNSNMSAPVVAITPSETMKDPSLRYYDDNGAPYCINAGLDMSIIGMPTLGSDANGNVYMVFQGFKANDIETVDGTPYPYGHVYLTGSGNGTSWSVPKDLYNTTGEDVLFPSIADLVDSKVHILVQNDQSAGTWLQQASHPQNRDAFIYTTVDANTLVGVSDKNVAVKNFELQQNFPNPFNPTTNIRFSLPEAGNVTLKVFDTLGKEVATLVNGYTTSGTHEVTLNAANLASGLYIYKLSAGEHSTSMKMMLLK